MGHGLEGLCCRRVRACRLRGGRRVLVIVLTNGLTVSRDAGALGPVDVEVVSGVYYLGQSGTFKEQYAGKILSG